MLRVLDGGETYEFMLPLSRSRNVVSYYVGDMGVAISFSNSKARSSALLTTPPLAPEEGQTRRDPAFSCGAAALPTQSWRMQFRSLAFTDAAVVWFTRSRNGLLAASPTVARARTCRRSRCGDSKGEGQRIG